MRQLLSTMSMLFYAVVRRTSVRLCLTLAVLALLVSCGAPDKENVRQDFKQLFAIEAGTKVQPIIISVGPGEGDADNVYQHIKFDVFADDNVTFQKGWLAGITLTKGQKLSGGEVVLLYQRKSGSGWVMTRHELTKRPSLNQ